MSHQILQGDVRAMLATLPDASVQCVVTSPPYYALRAYGTNPQVWGGNPEHSPHEWQEHRRPGLTGGDGSTSGLRRDGRPEESRIASAQITRSHQGTDTSVRSDFCPCGAWRGELGSEPTPIPDDQPSLFGEEAS